jgi:hypothetical protein
MYSGMPEYIPDREIMLSLVAACAAGVAAAEPFQLRDNSKNFTDQRGPCQLLLVGRLSPP